VSQAKNSGARTKECTAALATVSLREGFHPFNPDPAHAKGFRPYEHSSATVPEVAGGAGKPSLADLEEGPE